jgi:hypothetical protein
MKVLFLFRGELERHARGVYSTALQCIHNWKNTLFDDLTNNGIDYDIAFITYETNDLNKTIEALHPKIIRIIPCISAMDGFNNTVTVINEEKNNYDRFVIMRFDFMYRIPITSWPKWNETGYIVVNKDVHWPSQKLYADIVFIIDKENTETFFNAWTYATERNSTHYITQYYFIHNIPFHLMYTGYYHMHINHPLHSLVTYESDPDLHHPILPNELLDISQWN